MAITDCFKCGRGYLDQNDSCPHCGCHNFFADDDTMPAAVHLLIENVKADKEEERREKQRELARVQFWLHPPWWMRALFWLRETFT